MFTGIIEQTGVITAITIAGSNKTFWVESPVSHQLKVDQSLSHNGVCLTVEEITNGQHRVTAIDETMTKTNLSHWTEGTFVNLERCMQMNGRLDGHIVQGHVDSTAVCTNIVEKHGSWEFSFEIDGMFSGLIIEKGSVCLNGISLTVFNITKNTFTVGIIPYTYNHTNIKQLKKGNLVNIEFDVLGKYVQRMLQTANEK